MTRSTLTLAASLALVIQGPGCSLEPEAEDIEYAETPRVEVMFNNTGTREENGVDTEVDDILIAMLDRANVTIDVATMGFSRGEVIDALVRAHHRGVRLRFVGDSRHLERFVDGYEMMDHLNIESMSGNMYHIMHDKFFIVDGRWLYTGTGNTTPTGFDRNDNNYVFIDSPQVAADFTDEFEQMLSGRFGTAKEALDNGNTYVVGDTTVEVYFSPQEDAMGRILEEIENAQQSVHFMIFAFTKDQVGSAFIERHQAFERYNRCCDPAATGRSAEEAASCETQVVCEEPFIRREVRGVLDRSQLHGNGPYHEAYRLIMNQLNLRLDNNENSRQPGDYQAGGGRLHSKTMVIDAGTPNARVITGSFNWSSSATIANDETLLILHGERVSGQVDGYFERLWDRANRLGVDHADPGGTVQPGDVVFNEIHWDGYNGLVDTQDFARDLVYNDEFIELLNTTDRTIDLSLWVIGSETDFMVGIFPGTVIGPYERFLIVDHNVAPYDDLAPQLPNSAFQNADFVMNTANDVRFLRLNLHNLDFFIQLFDARGNVIDVAGNGGPAFYGGRRTVGGEIRNYSMERVHVDCDGQGDDCEIIGPGDERDSWAACVATKGNDNVRPQFRDVVIATPGEENSIGERYPAEDPTYRNPAQ